MLLRTDSRFVVAASLLALAGCSANTATAIEPLTPGEPHYGHTHEELAGDWWAWHYGMPQAGNPVLDTTGADCANGQPDDVFFLAGTYGESVRRTCTLPAGRPIFFPIVNINADNGGVPADMLATEAELTGFVSDSMDAIDTLSLEIDGASWDTEALRELRVDTRFAYDVPDVHPNIYDRYDVVFSGHVEPAFTDGYWVYLPPLPAGTHHIAFTASDAGDPADPMDDWALDVAYDLTVE